jgi:hypothetical protein
MTMMDISQQRLQEADGLAAILDAAYATFEGMHLPIHHSKPSSRPVHESSHE